MLCVKGVAFNSSKSLNENNVPGVKGRLEAKGKQIYVNHMKPNIAILKRTLRCSGVIAEIGDKLRYEEQTEEVLIKLSIQRRKFPESDVNRGIHFNNEAAHHHNWRTLWKHCKENDLRMFVIRAEYHQTDSNQYVIEQLQRFYGHHYDYAPHLLCVVEGCEVRLVINLDVQAGLVNSALGKVVKIVFDAADVDTVLAGKYPIPFCIVVDFPRFRGYILHSGARDFPFPKHPTWVPVFKRNFTISQKELPRSILQKASLCYRYTFPLDGGLNLTVHRSQ